MLIVHSSPSVQLTAVSLTLLPLRVMI